MIGNNELSAANAVIGYAEGLLELGKISEPFASALKSLIKNYDVARISAAEVAAFQAARAAGLNADQAFDEAEDCARRLKKISQ